MKRGDIYMTMMYNDKSLLRKVIRGVLLEIKRTSDLTGGNINYDEFVDWAKGVADNNKSSKFDKFSGYEFQWSEGPEDVKIIVHKDSAAIGYVSIEKFKDGYKINTLGVKPSATGSARDKSKDSPETNAPDNNLASKPRKLSTIIYDYIVSKVGKLYSDVHQTPQARKLWTKLAQDYDVRGHYIDTGEEFPVQVGKNGELVPDDEKHSLYKDAPEATDTVDVHNDDNVCHVLYG